MYIASMVHVSKKKEKKKSEKNLSSEMLKLSLEFEKNSQSVIPKRETQGADFFFLRD